MDEMSMPRANVSDSKRSSTVCSPGGTATARRAPSATYRHWRRQRLPLGRETDHLVAARAAGCDSRCHAARPGGMATLSRASSAARV